MLKKAFFPGRTQLRRKSLLASSYMDSRLLIFPQFMTNLMEASVIFLSRDIGNGRHCKIGIERSSKDAGQSMSFASCEQPLCQNLRTPWHCFANPYAPGHDSSCRGIRSITCCTKTGWSCLAKNGIDKTEVNFKFSHSKMDR